MEYILELAKAGFVVEIEFNPRDNSYLFYITKNGFRCVRRISTYEYGMMVEARCIRGFLKSMEDEFNLDNKEESEEE